MAVFETLASLRATTDDFPVGTRLYTMNFYENLNGGGSTYVVSSTPLPGFTTDDVGQIPLPNGKYPGCNTCSRIC